MSSRERSHSDYVPPATVLRLLARSSRFLHPSYLPSGNRRPPFGIRARIQIQDSPAPSSVNLRLPPPLGRPSRAQQPDKANRAPLTCFGAFCRERGAGYCSAGAGRPHLAASHQSASIRPPLADLKKYVPGIAWYLLRDRADVGRDEEGGVRRSLWGLCRSTMMGYSVTRSPALLYLSDHKRSKGVIVPEVRADIGLTSECEYPSGSPSNDVIRLYLWRNVKESGVRRPSKLNRVKGLEG
ncbi:hypothetical protein DFP72DRAFT_1041104 [Ephemerocybe angulata]|uniref:Uncharacterized protein n=1 Tax=Ephemerocybe angulata TaxID=980116 RepID=A0A8H6MEV0_9AGAR|nr:hypothetical protein DFP72DRAFT_1041104 [Tulosesus angulatus]